ncbi:hypothetical protein [Burkholderia diffusa]|uniref:hypothetical protein n=1 Tax=Burkholderia diffusa TaxID=488732 RepID=UPI000841BC38|nr:hypothetical protein [Burkholderia diffusa]AOI57409.1 hypothetical protein WI26_07220 [Burkholderia diffusa]
MKATTEVLELEAYGPFVSARRGDTTHQVADCSVHPHGREYARLFAAAPRLLVVAHDFEEVLRELNLFCECGRTDCRTTRLREALELAKNGLPTQTTTVRHFRACGEDE